MTTLLERTRSALAGEYAVERELGRGGMATVFLALDLRHDRPVAVKVLHPELAASLGDERFLREVRVTARLHHPHILPLLDSGERGGLLYYVMPRVEGGTLRARMDRSGALPVDEAVAVAREIADALAYAHGRSIVHRDVKPENVFLESGHALVADFGIARAVGEAAPDRLTETGLALGTPHYMSPEQMEGRSDVDGRSDVYALGCLLYEMLAGEPPFSGPTAAAIMARRLTEAAPPIRSRRESVSGTLETIVHRALQRTPGDRFQSAEGMRDALASVRGAQDPETVGAGAPVGSGPPQGRRPARRWLAVGAGVVAVTIAVVGWVVLGGGGTTTHDPLRSVAVLPLVNVGGDTAQVFFVDGLTEELIATLSQVEGLQVASRTSSFAFRRQELDIREIGRRLGVQAVLEGSVRRGEDRVRITVRLVNVDDGYQRWAETYDRHLSDALALQGEIATGIVYALQGALDGAPVVAEPVDPETYDLYLLGRFYRNLRTEAGLRRSVEIYEEAIRRTPEFARAHAGLAESHAVLGFYSVLPAREAFPAAAAAAHEALRLDPNVGSARATLGYTELYHEWDWEQAEEEFRRAIAQEPSYSVGHQWYANFLVARGRFDEAERSMRTARELDPFATITSAALGWALYHSGDFPRAAAQLRETIQMDSTFALSRLWYGQTLEALGELEAAERELRHGVELAGETATYLAPLARVVALRGRDEDAHRLLGRVREAPVPPPYEIAKVHLALGDRAEALRWLERGYEERAHFLVFLRVDPQLVELQGDPTFEALVRRVGVD